MSKIRIYQAGSFKSLESIELGAAASHHVSAVLRMVVGEELILFSGDNREFDAIITAIRKKKVLLSLIKERLVSRESSLSIHLAQSISKGERMEWIVQKAVELGTFSITPLITARTVVKLNESRMEKKIEQWKAIAIGACEQSGRNQLPEINTMLSLDDYLKTASLKRSFPLVKFVLDPRASQSWRSYPITKENVALLVGPEGGFSKEEMENILSSGFKPLSLGPRVLRTETAAIAAVSLLQAVWGDL